MTIYYTIYKTTNLINNKYYIGMHQTKDLDDGYMGSGKHLKNAIKKYGIENFKKEILFIFNNLYEMIEKEKELVTEDVVRDKMSYNKVVGGKGGNIIMHNKSSKKYKQAIEKMKNTKRINKQIPWNKGVPMKKETKEKLSANWKNRLLNGYKHDNTKSRRNYQITYNNGNKQIINGLSTFCKENGYCYSGIKSLMRGERKYHKNIIKVEKI